MGINVFLIAALFYKPYEAIPSSVGHENGDVGNVAAMADSDQHRHLIDSAVRMKTIWGDSDDFSTTNAVPHSLFGSTTVVTNCQYRKVVVNNDDLEREKIQGVEHTLITCSMHSSVKMEIAKHMAYVCMYQEAHREYGRHAKTALNATYWDFPFALPINFSYKGHKCSEYDLIMVPFVVSNPKFHSALESVVCKFFCSNEFVFALYINLNEMIASHDFFESSHYAKMLASISRFPFLDNEEAAKQWNDIKADKLKHSLDKLQEVNIITNGDIYVEIDL